MSKTNKQQTDNFNTEAHQKVEDSFFGNVIYSYTRRQAIEDGVLVDVTDVAKNVGFKIPVALTEAVYSNCVQWTELDSDKQTYQDQSGRLKDVLMMAFLAARRRIDTDTVHFQTLRIERDGKSKFPDLVQMKMVVSGGDDGEPVVTIMFPNED
jgi:type I site-specific restriction-modification system R (restriction) subunit